MSNFRESNNGGELVKFGSFLKKGESFLGKTLTKLVPNKVKRVMKYL